jgi:hypothetical protein
MLSHLKPFSMDAGWGTRKEIPRPDSPARRGISKKISLISLKEAEEKHHLSRVFQPSVGYTSLLSHAYRIVEAGSFEQFTKA